MLSRGNNSIYEIICKRRARSPAQHACALSYAALSLALPLGHLRNGRLCHVISRATAHMPLHLRGAVCAASSSTAGKSRVPRPLPSGGPRRRRSSISSQLPRTEQGVSSHAGCSRITVSGAVWANTAGCDDDDDDEVIEPPDPSTLCVLTSSPLFLSAAPTASPELQVELGTAFLSAPRSTAFSSAEGRMRSTATAGLGSATGRAS